MAEKDEDKLDLVELEGTHATLAELAGLNLDDIAEKRMFGFPRGIFSWEVMQEEDSLPHLEAINGKPAAVVQFSCIDVHSVNPQDKAEIPNGDVNTLIGKRHREAFFFSKLEDIGFLKAFINDVGGAKVGTFGERLRSLGGLRFTAPIVKRKDKNDSDKTYTNIDRQKVKPIAGQSQPVPGFAGTPAAAPTAGATA